MAAAEIVRIVLILFIASPPSPFSSQLFFIPDGAVSVWSHCSANAAEGAKLSVDIISGKNREAEQKMSFDDT